MHELLGPELPVELLIFADDLEALGADINGRRGIVCSYALLSCFGFPFKWSKQRVGMKVEWIGLFADYTSMKLGLSPKRASWLSDWVLKVAKDHGGGATDFRSDTAHSHFDQRKYGRKSLCGSLDLSQNA